ncbi:hypothetical protein DMC01_11875 [Campylobacter troglodytis]|nr:hypothetical protein DMC01_11875 [Campylobacter troglodytis]
MKNIYLILFILLCVSFFGVLCFVIVDFYHIIPTLCDIQIAIIKERQMKCLLNKSKEIKAILYCIMICALFLFSLFWIKRENFICKKVNLLYLWFGGTQCICLVLLKLFS